MQVQGDSCRSFLFLKSLAPEPQHKMSPLEKRGKWTHWLIISDAS